MLLGDENFLYRQTFSVSSEELVLLPCLVRCGLSRLRFHSHHLLLSSYTPMQDKKENSSCSACEHRLLDLTHLLLHCPASEPLRRAIFSTATIFDLWSRPWGLPDSSWVSMEFLHAPIPRKGLIVSHCHRHDVTGKALQQALRANANRKTTSKQFEATGVNMLKICRWNCWKRFPNNIEALTSPS